MIRLTPFPPDLVVAFTGEASTLDPEIESEVEALWKAESARRPLHDGRVFSIRARNEARIDGCLVPYRRVVALHRRPGLAAHLGVMQLGVSGVLLCRDGVVLGRRSRALTHDPGRWETVPSGAVDPTCLRADGRVDLGTQLLRELEEETGCSAHRIDAVEPWRLAEDPDQFVTDAVFLLRTSATWEEIHRAFSRSGCREYEELALAPEAGTRRSLLTIAILAELTRSGVAPRSGDIGDGKDGVRTS
jgi:8-oxo-dGTP pyrophosphatase MutT (NUDIX family)